jgi:hypothetical protein
MAKFSSLLLISVVVLATTLFQFPAAVWSLQYDLPVARIYQVKSENRLTPWTRITQDFETTIENVENLRLDCTASYPVEWLYVGQGIPTFTVTNKYNRKNSPQGETRTEFLSTILITPIKEHHTGKYICTPAEAIDDRTFFHIYVPGQNLFTSLTGHNIILPRNDTTILIPCTVSNPNALVTLDRSEGEVLRRIRVKSSDAVTYDPRRGFTVKTDRIDQSPEGTYVCTARLGTNVRSVEYQVRAYNSRPDPFLGDEAKENLESCKKECGENAQCTVVNGRETCQCLPDFNGDPNVKCVIKCNTHTDCPSRMSCFVDKQCRDPCIHSVVGCGINAKCRTENHQPICYCPKDWVGDETIQCFNTLQGSQPETPEVETSRPQTGLPRPSGSGVKCQSNTDCPVGLSCLRVGPSEKQCVDLCASRRCGVNAECKTENKRAFCQCLDGFYGDARVGCDRLPSDQPAFEPIILEPAMPKPSGRTRCNNPGACGDNAKCRITEDGVEQCFCREGFMGQPPKCRPECNVNADCPDKHVCTYDSRVGYPTCTKVCGAQTCGAHADCADFEDGTFECYCPAGLYGDPLVKCETKEMKLGRPCAYDYDCGVQLRCEIGDVKRECVDPCQGKICPSDLVCRAENHKPVCVCPSGFTGNQYVGCLKATDQSSEALQLCSNFSCGSNAECRVLDGRPKCLCAPGFVGRPPACIAQCFTNSDCPVDLTCVNKQCRHKCEGCGKGARCRVAPNLDRSPVCSCAEGHEGNPYVECKLVPK